MHIEEKSLGKLWNPNSSKLWKTILYFVSVMAAEWSFGNMGSVVQMSRFLTEVKNQIK